MVVGLGSQQQHAELLERIRRTLPPTFEFTTALPYVQLQKFLDESNVWGSLAYEKGTYLEQLSDDAIAALSQQMPAKPSPMSLLMMMRMDGAYSDVGEDETAFGGSRRPGYWVFIIGMAPDPELLAADRAWVRATWDALQPFARGGGYVNGQAEYPGDRVRAIYGDKYARLARIKARYDPDNVFHHNANVVPAQ